MYLKRNQRSIEYQDYESSKYLCLESNSLSQIDEEQAEEDIRKAPDNLCGTVLRRNGQFWFYHALQAVESEADLIQQPWEKGWLVARSVHKEGYPMRQGATIKFGRVRFKISKISSSETAQLDANNMDIDADDMAGVSEFENDLLTSHRAQMSMRDDDS